MKKLPEASIYEQEFTYFPWGELVEEVLEYVCQHAPRQGKLLDLMCGPGYLLGKIQEKRPDLALFGVDIHEEFIHHAQQVYQGIHFETADVLEWNAQASYDIILCTAGVHHLPYQKQAAFVKNIPSLLAKNGKAIFADPLVSDYQNELERKQAAAELGYEYLLATLERKAPDEIIKAAIDIIYNDVMGFEYKTSLEKIQSIYQEVFQQVQVKKTWPRIESSYGDYYFICK